MSSRRRKIAGMIATGVAAVLVVMVLLWHRPSLRVPVSVEQGIPSLAEGVQARRPEQESLALTAATVLPTLTPTPPVASAILPAGTASVSGTVRDTAGGPIEGIRLVAAAGLDTSMPQVWLAPVRTDRDGAYRIDSLVAGEAAISILLDQESIHMHVPAEHLVLRTGSHIESVDFVLEVGDVIDGFVRSRHGQPIAGARVEGQDDVAAMAGLRTRHLAFSREDGSFLIPGVGDRGVLNSVTVAADGYKSARRTHVAVLDGVQVFVLDPVEHAQDAPDATKRRLPDATPPNDAQVTLFGHVIDPEGHAVTGARIGVAQRNIGRTTEVLTDRAGEWRVHGLPAGALDVRLRLRDGFSQTRQVDVLPGAEQQVDFDFTGAVRLTGRATINGAPPERLALMMSFAPQSSDERAAVWVLPALDGSYEAWLFAGKWWLEGGPAGSRMPVLRSFLLDPEPPRQVRDFHVETCAVDVYVDWTDGGPFRVGHASLFQVIDGVKQTYSVWSLEMASARRHLPEVPAGDWIVDYVSVDWKHHFQGAPVRVHRGGENVLVVVPKPTY
ncbi:MAG: carboxypeptidase regulatory-like domain-containing protein [Candidatus Sumerlaeia bacterium]|nr:carboxypeptidase regulatory-like domain-containing protein [Candidatus Sumerlaeia bacterium]